MASRMTTTKKASLTRRVVCRNREIFSFSDLKNGLLDNPFFLKTNDPTAVDMEPNSDPFSRGGPASAAPTSRSA